VVVTGATGFLGREIVWKLMYELPLTLAAISAGAVFMGANSYIGNAPNFMVKAIVENIFIQKPIL